MKLNASNPFYTDGMGNAYKKISMNDLFYKDVFSEFMLDYVNPLYDDLKTRLNSVKAIKGRNVYKARPWLRKRK
ncbi:hypothetical protein OESDEN_12341 [Oesophagostomum dentatum]|uniref:Uncharacterized protein n=1 Tax=Oesophagostomum dentatum TaxID=61180 RepID=A0A0B1SRC8_OESDE|nr:hypothetical protein OESDEN_12341 [Oesophagostomum dentatum]